MNATKALGSLILTTSFLALTSALLPCLTSAQEPTGEEVMRRVEDLQGGWDDETATITFLIISKGEKDPATRVISRKRKNYRGKDHFNKKTFFFLAYPPGSRGFIYLSWSYVGGERGDDKWIYSPSGTAAKKTLRLRYDPEERFLTRLFHGIDFTYQDLTDRLLPQDTHRLLRQERYNYKDCYVIESIPQDEQYPYSKRISWIWKEQGLPVKVDHYDRKDKLIRTLFHHYWTEVQGVWVPRQSLMKDHEREHTTLLFVNDVRYNTGLVDAMFLPANLGYGR